MPAYITSSPAFGNVGHCQQLILGGAYAESASSVNYWLVLYQVFNAFCCQLSKDVGLSLFGFCFWSLEDVAECACYIFTLGRDCTGLGSNLY